MKQNLPRALELRNQKQFIMEGKLSFELMESKQKFETKGDHLPFKPGIQEMVYDWDKGFVVVILFLFILFCC